MHTIDLEQLKERVREAFAQHAADHDFDHILRVYNMAVHLAKEEGADLEKVACAALLHDISDHKLNGGKLNEGGKVSAAILMEMGADEDFAREVGEIVDNVSYKGSGVADAEGSLELNCVRDADRLDAMGAIGIARAFHFGGGRNRPFFEANTRPKAHSSFEEYASDKSHTINHFHEKLLLLRERLQTRTARAIGEDRHQLMQDFVDAFYRDWYFGENAEMGAEDGTMN